MRIFLPLALLMAACSSPQAPEMLDPQPPEPATCAADGYQYLVGRDAFDDIGNMVVRAMTLPPGTRIIEPNTAITMDYSAERMNIDIGNGGFIDRVWCG